MGKIGLTILMMFGLVVAKCQNERKLLLSGNELYKKQQFDKAAEQYQKATQIDRKNPTAQYNLGNALYKSKKADAAEKAFDAAVDNSKDVTVKSKSLYNKGVTLSRQNKLPESILAYKETLRLSPQDEEARENLQKALNELKKQQDQQQQQKQNKDDKKKQDKKDKKQPEPNQNKSKLNQKQVEQMLNALREDEKKLQQNLQKKNNTGGSNSKDW